MKNYTLRTFRGNILVEPFQGSYITLTLDTSKEFIEDLNKMVEKTRGQITCNHEFEPANHINAICKVCGWFGNDKYL